MSYARAISHAACVTGLVVLLPMSAAAQSGDKAVAEALFQDARDLLDQGKVAEACAKFAASQRVEPKLGTLLNLASCHETQGKTASAWAEFLEALAQAERGHQPDRISFAKTHADALEKRLSRIAFELADPEHRPDALILTMDGVPVDPSSFTTLFPMDPGPHTLVVSARGKRPWSHTFAMADGPAEDHLQIPQLEDEVEAPPPPTAPLGPQPGAPAAEHSSARPTAGWIALGIGALGIGIGTYAGLHAFSLRSDADKECDDSGGCSQRGLDLFSDVRTNANIATVAFGVGLVAIAIGTYLLVTDPSPPSHLAAHRPRWLGLP